MADGLKNFLQLIRWRDWALDKLPILYGACFYLIIVNGREAMVNVSDFLIFTVFSISSTIYGYVINNYADIEIDLKQGKTNDLANFSPAGRIIMLLVITVIVVASGWHFSKYDDFLVLWGIQFFIATFYSMPPIRFKERGLIGLIIPFLAQAVVPMLICFSIFGSLGQMEIWAFVLYAVFKGGAYDIGHQFYDYEGDKKTKTKTFAVQRGQHIVAFLFKLFLVLDRLCFIACLGIMTWRFQDIFDFLPLNPMVPVAGLYLIVFVAVTINEIRQKRIIDPYYQETRGLANILHIILPNILIPGFLTLLMLFDNTAYLWLTAFYTAWVMPTPAKLKWPFQALLKILK